MPRLKLTRSFRPDHCQPNNYLPKNPHSSRLCQFQLEQALYPTFLKTILIFWAGKIILRHFGLSHHMRHSTHCKSGYSVKTIAWLIIHLLESTAIHSSEQMATCSNRWHPAAFERKMRQLAHLNPLLGLFLLQTRLALSRSVCVQQLASGASIWQNQSHPSWLQTNP